MKHDPLLDQLAYGSSRDSRVGVIDIGSNSIRLVVYDGMKRVPLPIYNEKAFCTLGQGMSRTNRLNPQGVKMARQAIARLLTAARLNKVAELHIIATAAIRDADDGKAFVKELERTHKVKIDVISGKREAKYAALGIASSHYAPHGMVADLGGGSLELTLLHERKILHHSSQPMGSLRLLDRSKGKSELLDELIGKYLEQVEWLPEVPGNAEALYAVGGSFRALAKVHMRRTDYPLNLLHNYTLDRDEMMPLLEEIANYNEAQCAELPVSSKRQPQLPVAARIMLELLEESAASKVVFSTSGIREGLLFSQLSPYLQKEDLLLSSSHNLRASFAGKSLYARELFEWMNPLFTAESEAMRRVRLAACMLHHLAMNIQSANRAEWAYHHVLQATIRGLEHQERIALAAALYHRYRTSMKDEFGSYALLSESWKSWAALTGAAMRLGYRLSGGAPGNLEQTKLRLDDDRPALRLSNAMKPLQGETLERRKQTLSGAYVEFMRAKR